MRRLFLFLHAVYLLAICLYCTSSFANQTLADFPEPKADFQEHINDVTRYLRVHQMHQRSESDVLFNIPFEKKANASVAYRGKFLLVHGLNDSPYVFTDVAEELSSRGFDVRAILLPGHGSTPEAQLTISHKDWLNSARQQFRFWQNNESVPTYLGGFSMGAVIATILALENDSVDGLLLFSPAFRSSKHRMLRWSGIYSRFKPWVFGGMIIEDNPTKYNSIPINGVSQYYKVTQTLKRLWKSRKLDIPVLAVASVNDSVVDIDNMKNVFSKRFTSTLKRLILYSNEHDEGVSVHAKESGVYYRASAVPELRVLNQSHQGVIMSSANPLFGVNGSVLVCNGNDWPTFSACLYSQQRHWFGAQHTPSPDSLPVARTTYNPDFSGVFAQFDKVFE